MSETTLMAMKSMRRATSVVAASSSSIAKLTNQPSLPITRFQFSIFSASHSVPGLISFPHKSHSEFRYAIRTTHGATVDQAASGKKDGEEPTHNWKIKMLYDGDCPLCMREVNMLRERDKRYGAIKFVDISSEKYSPKENLGLEYETVMGRIHAIEADGTVVTDVEAFRRLYEEVGLGWVYAITKYKPIAKVADVVYGIWAKYRLQMTGRPPLEHILEARKSKYVIARKAVGQNGVLSILHAAKKLTSRGFSNSMMRPCFFQSTCIYNVMEAG